MTGTSTQERRGEYDFTRIEARWQRYWEEHETFRTPDPGDPGVRDRPKFYILDMFPYPSGAGLHVGHPLGYCATDIIARFKRMCGYNVLHPMGFDAFGLPAEQYAIEHNVHPAVTTRKNIDTYRRQLKMFGLSYDWSREIATCDPSYYKFTQWIFLRLFESWYDRTCRWHVGEGDEIVGRARPIATLESELAAGRWGVDDDLEIVRDRNAPGRREWADLSAVEQRRAIDHQRLARLDDIPVNWCPALGTVLANEEVDSEGRSDRGGHPVYRRPLRQWVLRITEYADRLLADLDALDWPEPLKLMQRNWIGRSTGAEVVFPLADRWTIEDGAWKCLDGSPSGPLCGAGVPHTIRVYTTRPDTLFGATYMVLAPEHPLVDRITTAGQRAAVDQYVEATRHRSDLDRTADAKDKTGVFTGAYAINPVNGARIPIWVADYVLMGYGTGAIMAVPGGDSRDFAFAVKFNLPIVAVVRPPADWIEQRLSALTAGMDVTAAAGFDEVARAFPELADAVATRRRRSADLADQTRAVLCDRVGIDRLIDHYVRRPRVWGDAFTGEGVSVNSPGEAPDADEGGAPDTAAVGGAPALGGTAARNASGGVIHRCPTPAGDARDARGVAVPGGVCRLDGLTTAAAQERMVAWLETNGVGRRAVNYKLRDWIFSRQKYWGEPFPVWHGEDGGTTAVDEAELPVELPPMDDFAPTPVADDAETPPEPPLGRAAAWRVAERDGHRYYRDLNTMPQWAGSCWYYLRYLDPHNTERFCDADVERYWMPVDLYVGGAEHAVLHLLYARFWHKVLFDLGFVSTREPFRRLFNQGKIQSFAYVDRRGRKLSPEAVEARPPGRFVLKDTGEEVKQIVAKMSKGLKNVVSPDPIIAEYGADTFRLYEMYMGPLDTDKPWNTRDVPGLFKLCQRIWRLVVDPATGGVSPALTNDEPADAATLRVLHKTIKKVTGDLEQLKFNTAIAAIFDFVNALTPLERRPRAVIEPFVLLLAPFAPHLAEELWHRLGHDASLAYETWPVWDEGLARDEAVEMAVQILGKVRARITVAADADEHAVEAAALGDARVQAALCGRDVRKVVVVKGRLINIVPK
ncbi:MAG: leucine--tRNA ligase [Phycisphaerae bacterium]